MTADPSDQQAGTTPVHIINHTHWDREWFLTHEYTTAWIPDLIDALVDLAARNDAYEYLFDGQTLVIEDLLATRPEYRDEIERLVAAGNLSVGPLYSQADWRTVGGQLHVRNLLYGTADAADLGGEPDVAWLVDLFGHISQVPQLLMMAGVDAAYVWRGVPAMHPVFDWSGADGSRIVTVDLFGGYRNLYGITKTPDIAAHRLVAETRKLEPYYGDLPIPLFDGYDLDSEPEDPVRHYAEHGGVPSDIDVVASSPRRYVEAVSAAARAREEISGELLSGRFGATFPGSLSTRTYLKVLHHDAEEAVCRRAEPLATLAAACGREYPAEWFERAGRELLRNGVHDCICGVSIDQVHERMERSYRRIIDEAAHDIEISLAAIMAGFRPGTYAVSTVAFDTELTQRVDDRVVVSSTEGIGVWPVADVDAVRRLDERVDRFAWSNSHFSIEIDRAGIRVDGSQVARVVVRRDRGDTYSSEFGEVLGECAPVADPTVESRSDHDVVVGLATRFSGDGVDVRATMRVRLDAGPLVHFAIDLDSDGVGYRVDAEFDTGVRTETAVAAMPFDLVERRHVDDALLPYELDAGLAAVLMGQREVDLVDEFPMQGFVALQGASATRMALAKGVRSYRSAEGLLSVALRRSVEWVALSSLDRRQGDAGPAMYVPGARCERSVRHELGYAVIDGIATASDLWRIGEGFHQPPLIVEVGADSEGSCSEWPVFREALPITGLELAAHGAVVRTFNPEPDATSLGRARRRRSVRGAELGEVEDLAAKAIVDLEVLLGAPFGVGAPLPNEAMRLHGLPEVRVGRSRSRPDPAVMEQLDARRRRLTDELVEIDAELVGTSGADRYRLTHRRLVVDRERAELALSLELNRRLTASTDVVSIPDGIDPDIARLGRELNALRVDRRIYDYVVQAL